MMNELTEAKAARKIAKKDLLTKARALDLRREDTIHAVTYAASAYQARCADVLRLKINDS